MLYYLEGRDYFQVVRITCRLSTSFDVHQRASSLCVSGKQASIHCTLTLIWSECAMLPAVPVTVTV